MPLRLDTECPVDKDMNGISQTMIQSNSQATHSCLCICATVTLAAAILTGPGIGRMTQARAEPTVTSPEMIAESFQRNIQPLLKKFCFDCHNVDEMTSGVRVDHLDGSLEDRQLYLWEVILKQIDERAMPPEDELQLTDVERSQFDEWIRRLLITAKSREAEKNGSVRRLTVAQYRNTLRDLLLLDDDLSDVLPPDAVSKDGFLNNEQTMVLSPLLLEAYFSIASRALDLCIVDTDSKPQIQNFRMDFGESINPEPCPDRLILGANSLFLRNQDFTVTQRTVNKPFKFDPFTMRTKYRFNEGYQGNATVRGWREFDSIYHAVFACMRGTPGYPKGRAFETLPEGLTLRPAVPSAELFQVESTYGPKANFKISLRELPDQGNFRVTVRAARYDDGLLLDAGVAASESGLEDQVNVAIQDGHGTAEIEKPGIYQADVLLADMSEAIAPDDSKLDEQLVGVWPFDEDVNSRDGEKEITGELVGNAKLVASPFGKAVRFNGDTAAVVAPRDDVMNVGEGEFSVAAWIRPTQLRQAGIVCLGRYSYVHGWYFDMPQPNGVLRIETMTPDGQRNGTVQSRPGTIRRNQWQHVAAVVRRGSNQTRLYVNGIEVAVGTINAANLDNPKVSLHIGRIEGAQLFKGDIDEVRFYRRALSHAEVVALVQPGKHVIKPLSPEKNKYLSLRLGARRFSGQLNQPAFLAVKLPAGSLDISADYEGRLGVRSVVLSRLKEASEVRKQFEKFDQRRPRVGVHVGLRRDCGSTLSQVGGPQTVTSTEFTDFVFEDAIGNYPSPDIEEDNDNYLAGLHEIGVRSEYTDGRDMPRLLIDSVEFEGPYYETWPPATHRNIFIESQHRNDPAVYAREIIRSFATRAFRRPITDQEEGALFAVWERAWSESRDFQTSIKDALIVVLTSPQFLFLIEASATPDPEPIDSHELASKLSYFLWNAAPDERLRTLAERQQLREGLSREVERLVQDSQFDQFAHEFVSRWLSLEKLEVVETDRKRFPRLTRDTKEELRLEPVRFVKHLIRNNLPVRNLIESDFVVANEVVASYYGLPDRTESGFDFVAIPHGNQNLGGLLSQAGILAGLSNGRESNPVKRGAWLARKIIAEPPADPPPNVPDLEEDTSDLPLRDRLERHRNQPGCAKCHSGIDPWGVPFEQINAGGLFKQDASIDASSVLPDATRVDDLNGLKSYLANDRIDQVAFSFLKHVATYAVGRTLTYKEIEFLKAQGLALKDDDYRMQDMIQFIVSSELFLEK